MAPAIFVIEVTDVLVHRFASVTVTVYEPIVSPVTVIAVEPLFHVYVNVPVPPAAFTLTEPFELPHVDETEDALAVTAVGCVMLTVLTDEQLFASRIVTVYVFCESEVTVCAVDPLLQL